MRSESSIYFALVSFINPDDSFVESDEIKNRLIG